MLQCCNYRGPVAVTSIVDNDLRVELKSINNAEKFKATPTERLIGKLLAFFLILVYHGAKRGVR